MKEKRKEIESVVRKCASRLNMQVSEEQIQSIISRLMDMQDIKTVMDSLFMTIDKFLGAVGTKKILKNL